MVAPTRPSRPWLAPLLLVLAVGQILSSLLVPTGELQNSDRAGEPPIVPPGFAFSIWGLVLALSAGYALWALLTRRQGAELRERLAAPLAVVFAGFAAWLVAAVVQPTWATLVIFLVMLAGLFRALSVAFAARAEIGSWSRLGRGLLWGTLGVYTGWSSIAVWLNLTTSLALSGAPITGTAGVLGQLAVLAGATATACAVVWWTRGLLPYVGATAWALAGAALGASGAGEPVLAVTALVGLVVVGVVTAVRRVGPGARVPARPAA